MPIPFAGRPCAPRLTAAILALCLIAPSPALSAPLRLEEALALAAAADPRREAGGAQLAASLAEEKIAGLRPDPALGVEVENALGTGVYSGLSRAEVTVAFEQTWERGGKREARVALAQADAQVARLRQNLRRLDTLRDVAIDYVEALAAEAEVVVAEAALVSAQQSQAEIDRRVKGARDPLFAGARAEALTAQAQIARDQAKIAAATARKALAAWWGGDGDLELPVEGFFATSPAPSAGGETPDLAILAAERDARIAAIDLARTQSAIDPALRGGVRYLADESEAALVVGASIPLQRRARAAAGLDRALAERNAAEAELVAARAEHQRDRDRLLARMSAAATESERIRAEVIPAALRTLDLVREGFARGGFAYDDVTGAERALVEARQRRIAVLRDYHLARVALERLTGRYASLASSHTEPRS